MKIRLVFMGSPEFSVPILEKLNDNFFVIGIITQPDRPSGRGRNLTPPPVKRAALRFSIPFTQPQKVKDIGVYQQIELWEPDLIVVAAYGQILRKNILDYPKYGCINVHASLLPRWRGAAPIQAAILNGDEITGITIMKMDEGLDTGQIIKQELLEILPEDTTGSLSDRLSVLGAELLVKTIPEYISGKLLLQPQDEFGVTYAPMLKKEDGELNFFKPAVQLVNQVRAFTPWPGAFIYRKGIILRILKAHSSLLPESGESNEKLKPGNKIIFKGLPAVVTSKGIFIIDEIQPSGKKPMSGKSFLQGARDWN